MAVEQRGFGATLVRVGLVQAFVLLVVAIALIIGLGHRETASDTRASAALAAADQSWHGDYSDRFPGCVAEVLWPTDEMPAALVVEFRNGSVRRLSLAEFRSRATGGASSEGQQVIGACRVTQH
jgi:hypothetical protein